MAPRAGDYRMRMVQRLAALIVEAQRSRHMPSLADLAREHQVCERTIRRDLAVIGALVPCKWRRREAA